MKKLTKSVLAILVIASSITACKKGDDDPGFSLKSRKGRLSTTWNVTELKSDVTSVTTSNGTTTYTQTTKTTDTYAGATAKREVSTTYAGGGSTTTSSDSYSGAVSDLTYTFEKDGTWSSTQTVKWSSVTHTEAGTTTTDAIDFTETTTQSGTWYFLGKNKSNDDKNKENISLSVLKEQRKTDQKSTTGGNYSYSDDYTYTYANNENTQVWHLSRLAKSELVGDASIDMTMNGSNSNTQGGNTTTTKYGPNSSKGTISIKMEKK